MSDIPDFPFPSRPRTFYYYLVLIGVTALYVITPISWAFVAYTFYNGLPTSPRWMRPEWMPALFFWSCLEVIFSLYHFYLARSIQALSPHTAEDLAIRPETFLTVLKSVSVDPNQTLNPDDPEAIDIRQRLRTWFRKAPWSDITKEGMLTWLSWSCFDLPLEEALKSPTRKKTLYELLDLVERRAGTRLPDEPMKVVPLRLTLDRIDIWSKPLLLYVGINLGNCAVTFLLRYLGGFRKGAHGSLEYFIRMPAGWTPEKGREDPGTSAPVIFVHGLGVGLIEYAGFLVHFVKSAPSHPIVVQYLPHISYDLWHPRYFKPMGRKETVHALAALIDEMDFGPKKNEDGTEEGGVVFISHSNGSMTHAWMMKEHPELLRRSCFVDPVTFNLWEGDVCYNFVYRPPAAGMELAMWYFVGAELGTANLLQRHFDWTSNMLLLEEVKDVNDPMKNLFILGGRDAISDTERLRNYLHAHGVNKGLIFDATGGHGAAILVGSSGVNTIIDWVNGEWTPRVLKPLPHFYFALSQTELLCSQ